MTPFLGSISIRRALLAVAAVSLPVVVVVGAAWACTPQPRSFTVTPKAAEPGAAASVVGQGVPANAPVEIRWDDAQGVLIGSTTADDQGRFQAAVSIPQAASGVHTVVFEAGFAQSALVSVGRLPFQVGAAASSSAAALVQSQAWSSSPQAVAGSSQDVTGLVGLALLGVGGVALSGGAFAAAVGRRRRKVNALR